MRRSHLSVLLLLAGSARLASAQDDVAARIQRVERGLRTATILSGSTGMTLAERMTLHRVPGVSIAVINDGRIEWAKGYGVAEVGGAPVDTATLFQAASISKPVAAMAALRLVEQGRLVLDEDVNRRLRSWKLPENDFTRAQKVTLRRLLSHNAGTTVHGFRGYAQGEAVPSTIEVLDGVRPRANSAPVRVDTLPGAMWRYSGGGTTIVQLLMQDVTGRPFPELLREFVLMPANMVHSTYEQPLPAARAPQAATGYRATGQPVTGRWHTYPEMFAAGLWTTPSDLARLALEVQRSLRGESNRIISQDMTRQMLTVQAGGTGLGFGVERGDSHHTFSHGGANEGFRALFLAYADRGQGVVIMTNSDSGSVLAAEIVRAVAHEYDWPTQRAVERTTVPIDVARLQPLTGSYRAEVSGTSRTLIVTLDGDVLRVAGLPQGMRPVHHAGADTFFPLDVPIELRFERDAGGAGSALHVRGPGVDARFARVPQ